MDTTRSFWHGRFFVAAALLLLALLAGYGRSADASAAADTTTPIIVEVPPLPPAQFGKPISLKPLAPLVGRKGSESATAPERISRVSAQAELSVSPQVAPPGTSIAVVGAGFTAGATVHIYDNGNLVQDLVANGSGQIYFYHQSGSTAQPHRLLAIEDDGRFAGGAFTTQTGAAITPGLAMAPLHPIPGRSITFLVVNFPPSVNASLDIDGGQAASAPIGIDGRASYALDLPNLTAEAHVLAVRYQDNIAGQSFQVAHYPAADAQITGAIGKAGVDNKYSFVVEGFAPGEAIDVTVGSSFVGQISANDQGVAWQGIRSPSPAVGLQRVTFHGATSGRFAGIAIYFYTDGVQQPGAVIAPQTDTVGATRRIAVGSMTAHSAYIVYINGEQVRSGDSTGDNGEAFFPITSPSTPGVYNLTVIDGSGKTAVAPLVVVNPSGNSCVVYSSTDIPKTISDNSSVSSSLVVSSTGLISDINVVGLSITHTWMSDLNVALQSPDGSTITLFSSKCAASQTILSGKAFGLDDSAVAAIGDTCPPLGLFSYRPQQPLANFNGQSPNGTWQLRISDTSPGNSGVLNAWGLEVCSMAAAPTATSTSTPTITGTPTNTPIPSETSAPTNTPTITTVPTFTNTPTATGTPPTATPTGTPTVTSPPTVTGTATPCVEHFLDVSPSDTAFYDAVNYMYCHGIISGYEDGTFRPFNNATRGQVAKIIVVGMGWPIYTAGGPHFSDVPYNNVFYPWIETAFNREIISGYADGTFRWEANVTRGQLSKIVVSAKGWQIDTNGGPHFIDVPTNNPFYDFVETAYAHGVISGYGCGANCLQFRWFNNATRGQISKVVWQALLAE